MVAGRPLVIVSGSAFLPIAWAGDFGRWPSSCLEVSISAYHVGKVGDYGGRLTSCYCLVVSISAYHVGGVGDFGGRLTSCCCLEVSIYAYHAGVGLWSLAVLLLLPRGWCIFLSRGHGGGFWWLAPITWAVRGIMVAGRLFQKQNFIPIANLKGDLQVHLN